MDMNTKKYELTDETLEYAGHILHRIRAVRDFGCVTAGELGGWIEHEHNLSQNDNCWVFEDAYVYSNASVLDNALVYGEARISGRANIADNAQVYCSAHVTDYTYIFGNAQILGGARVCGEARVYGQACIFDNACITGNACVYGEACVCDEAYVYDYARIHGSICIAGNAQVGCSKDYIVFKNWWGSDRYFIWTRSNNKWRVGCFYGTGEELIKRAYDDSELNGREYERIVRYVESILADKLIEI